MALSSAPSGDGPRSASGDVVVRGQAGPSVPTVSRWSRLWPILLGAAVVVAVVAVVLAVWTIPAGSESAPPRPAAPPVAPSAGASGSTGSPSPPGHSQSASSQPPSSAHSVPVLPPAPTDDAGGLAAARARVQAFVDAMNGGNMQAANDLLCSSMAGWYGPGSLDGIVPGSLGVGGVSVSGAKGSAVITYTPERSDISGRSIYDLTVEDGLWMLCTPQ